MKNKIILALLVLVSFAVQAQDKNKKAAFEVDGRCDMCKVRIEKAALAVKGVKYADWNIQTHQLSLVFNENKANTMQIKAAIAKAGHDSKELKATEEAYEELHFCCKYREDDVDDTKEH